jgi:hypothetical protein
MEKAYILFIVALFAFGASYAQNTFPSTGNVLLDKQGYVGSAILFQGWGEDHLIRSESVGNIDNGHTRLRMYLNDDWTYDQGFEIIASRWDGPQRSLLYIPGDGSNASFYNGATFGGSVGIGTTNPDAKLAVKGIIHTQEIKVDMNGWSDYVFKPAYKLPSLSAVKAYIGKNKHLPDLPTENDVIKSGINLGEMNKILVKKIEELTLYLIEQKQQLKDQQEQINKLKATIRKH